jgi:hypothetical protein
MKTDRFIRLLLVLISIMLAVNLLYALLGHQTKNDARLPSNEARMVQSWQPASIIGQEADFQSQTRHYR